MRDDNVIVRELNGYCKLDFESDDEAIAYYAPMFDRKRLKIVTVSIPPGFMWTFRCTDVASFAPLRSSDPAHSSNISSWLAVHQEHRRAQARQARAHLLRSRLFAFSPRDLSGADLINYFDHIGQMLPAQAVVLRDADDTHIYESVSDALPAAIQWLKNKANATAIRQAASWMILHHVRPMKQRVAFLCSRCSLKAL